MSGRMRFPILKTLTLRVGVLEFQAHERLAEFLEKQLLLDGLHIHCRRPTATAELYRAIRRHSAKLKQFSLITFGLDFEGAEFSDWGFFREVRFLKNVELELSQPKFTDERRKSTWEVMNILPASLESAKISSVYEGAWNDENPHLRIIPCFTRQDSGISQN